jgi:hypothetical protein
VSDESLKDEVIDFDRRRLCSDGACTGVLDEEGRCKVCGLADDGTQVAPAARPDDDESDADADERDEGENDDARTAADADDRKLCPDGACIGLIGPDGKCKVCGLAEDASPPNAD